MRWLLSVRASLTASYGNTLPPRRATVDRGNPMLISSRSTQSFSCWFLPKSTVRSTPEPHDRLLEIL